MTLRTLFLTLAGAGLTLAQPSVYNGGVLNGASFTKGQAVSIGSLVSIFGDNLASRLAQTDTVPLSNSLGGVSVEFINGNTKLQAPMVAVAPSNPAGGVNYSQLNVQIPWELVPSGVTQKVSVIVTNNGKSSPAQTFTIGPFSPGIFSVNGRAIAQDNADGALAWPVGSAQPPYNPHPIKVGAVMTILGTGLGAIKNPPGPPADGDNTLHTLRPTLTTPQVLVGGVSAQVLGSVLSPQFVGVNQVNVIVPDVPSGDAVPLQFMMGGITSPSSVTIAVTH